MRYSYRNNVGEDLVLPLVTVEIIFKNKLYKSHKAIVIL